jgi:hypothetical protein
VIVKKPKTRSGAWMSATTLGRNRTSRIIRATLSTASPADAATSSTCDSHDGPSRNAPVETIPLAITNAKEPGSRSPIARAIRPGDRV